MTNGHLYKNIVLDFLCNKRVKNINRNGNLTRAGVAGRQREGEGWMAGV
jgi:hypothetical protein